VGLITLAGAKRLVQIGGILFGLASGQPLLVNACLKSLVHDVLLRAVSEKIGDLLSDTLEPAGRLTVSARPGRRINDLVRGDESQRRQHRGAGTR
jgi:hypothetical protein